MRYGFGVDIFGENTKIGFFDEEGRLIEKWKFATPMERDGSNILPTIADQIDLFMKKRRLAEDDIIGIGVGIPGPVTDEGTVGKCVNFGWGLFNLDRALSGLTGLKVRSSNIANMSAVGECWRGNGTRNTAFIAMNFGLGGAVVCNGSVVNGAHGGGGEIGHIQVNPEEKNVCTCGRRGCAEQYVSPTGILRMAKQQTGYGAYLSRLRRMRNFTYQDVIDGARQGDKLCKEVMDKVYDYTGQVAAYMCCITNPDTVVLGGEFCMIGQSAMDAIAKAFHKRVFHGNESVRFAFAALGTDACIYGAFKTVLDAYG